ncbi:MAG: hypothetical protein LBS00_02500 [Synergistaceae bacterium]|nr:hypothetical protein [Synergistaceae bacterium]
MQTTRAHHTSKKAKKQKKPPGDGEVEQKTSNKKRPTEKRPKRPMDFGLWTLDFGLFLQIFADIGIE